MEVHKRCDRNSQTVQRNRRKKKTEQKELPQGPEDGQPINMLLSPVKRHPRDANVENKTAGDTEICFAVGPTGGGSFPEGLGADLINGESL